MQGMLLEGDIGDNHRPCPVDYGRVCTIRTSKLASSREGFDGRQAGDGVHFIAELEGQPLLTMKRISDSSR